MTRFLLHIFGTGSYIVEKADKEKGVRMRQLIRLFPKEEQGFWTRVLTKDLTELRLRAMKPVMTVRGGREWYVDEAGRTTEEMERAKRFSREELSKLLLHLCKYSPYAYEEELREGYLTLEGGHRLGVAGQAVMDAGRIQTIKNVAFINLRIAREIRGAADGVLPYLYEGGELVNTLIVSPPGCGKTTLLRDLIRQISNGSAYGRGRTVGVVDVRSELGGGSFGVPQNDLGMRTDVLDGCPKAIGMRLLIRSMGPYALAVDEMGKSEDIEEMREAARCGVKLLATLHGASRHDVTNRGLEELFDCILIYGKGERAPVLTDHWQRRREKPVIRKENGGEMAGRGIGIIGEFGDGSTARPVEKTGTIGNGGDAGSLGTDRRRDPVWQGIPAGMLCQGWNAGANADWKAP